MKIQLSSFCIKLQTDKQTDKCRVKRNLFDNDMLYYALYKSVVI